jgi:hypothetical protein
LTENIDNLELRDILLAEVYKMRKLLILIFLMCFILAGAASAFAAFKYVKVASFKDIGQSRAFFIALKEEVPDEELEDGLWEVVDYYMSKYGQAPQMWIYFFDDKKYTPKDFPIEGESLDHLIAGYFYATDTRRKDLQIYSEADIKEIKNTGNIESPLWEGQ